MVTNRMFRGRRAASRWSAVVVVAVALVVTLIVTLIGQRIDDTNRRIDDTNRQFEASREAIEANGRRIDERFDALQALILEALEARRAQAD